MLYRISVAERGLTGIADIFRSRLSRLDNILRAGTVPLSLRKGHFAHPSPWWVRRDPWLFAPAFFFTLLGNFAALTVSVFSVFFCVICVDGICVSVLQRITLPQNVTQKYPRYKLYAYGEGSYTEQLRDGKFNGVPVLFIPGNGGSYKQGLTSIFTIFYLKGVRSFCFFSSVFHICSNCMCVSPLPSCLALHFCSDQDTFVSKTPPIST